MFSIRESISFSQKPVVAVDLTRSFMKAMRLSPTGEKWRVDFLEQVSLPDSIFEGTIVKNPSVLAPFIHQLFSSTHLKGAKVALALPDQAIISKVIKVNEKLNEEQIEALITLESEKYIPYSLEEVNFDFQILGPASKTGLVDVLLIATRQENVSSRVHAFEQANIQVELIDIESSLFERVLGLLQPTFSVDIYSQQLGFRLGANARAEGVYTQYMTDGERVCNNAENPSAKSTPQVTMVLDIGAYSLKQYVFEHTRTVFTKEEAFDTRQPIHKESVVAQVKRAIHFFFSVSNYTKMDCLYLAGECAMYPGLLALVAEQTQQHTELVNPFVHMEFTRRKDQEKLTEEGPGWLAACGLAIRGASQPFSRSKCG